MVLHFDSYYLNERPNHLIATTFPFLQQRRGVGLVHLLARVTEYQFNS